MSIFGPLKRVNIVSKVNDIITGESFDKLFNKLNHLSDKERSELKDSSINILKNSVNSYFHNNNKENNTGLVIGKIQSGKTLSFTSVISLARDNGYKIVVVISGRTNLLLEQTIKRLKKDLVKDDKYISLITNAEVDFKKEDSIRDIQRFLKKKNSSKIKTLIIPILKHQGRLRGLKNLFTNIDIQLLLKKNSVLIIDDEADQASLNTRSRNNERFGLNDESAIFSSIKNLRYVLPNHTYIQYTATPQAPLLIDTATLLSPDWHVLLTPGNNYTGGSTFFKESNDIVDIIPQEGQYPPNINHLTSAPESLVNSLKEFLILSALMGGDIERFEEINDRATMLVHPTWRVNSDDENIGIERFFDWIQNIIEMLEKDLENNDLEVFHKDFINVEKRLKKNGWKGVFPKFEIVTEAVLDWVLDDLKIHQVTGGKLEKGEEFPWDNNRYHILVGGQLLDRGFTVENLIMTYMPRDTVGNNQADTIEQRCRFYGYRRKYVDYCRVYITRGLKQDYIDYNNHEYELHKYLSNHTLEEFINEGSKMMMSKNLIPTNMSRISKTIISNHLKGFQHFNPQPPYLIENNQTIIDFIYNIRDSYVDDLKPRIIEHQGVNNVIHKVSKVPVSKIIDLLLDFQINNKFEIMKRASMLRYIDFLKKDFKYCWVIEVAYKRNEPRERTVKFRENPKAAGNQYQIPTLGAGDTKFKDGSTYFADRKLLVETDKTNESSVNFGYNNELILQIHKIKASSKSEEEYIKGEVFYSLALSFSEALETRYISRNS
jgi:hypothetical protein